MLNITRAPYVGPKSFDPDSSKLIMSFQVSNVKWRIRTVIKEVNLLPGLKPGASGLRHALVFLLLTNVFPNDLFLRRAHTLGKVAVRPETLAPQKFF